MIDNMSFKATLTLLGFEHTADFEECLRSGAYKVDFAHSMHLANHPVSVIFTKATEPK